MAMAAGGVARSLAASLSAAAVTAPQASAASRPRLESFADLVALAGEKRELKLKHALETTVRPVRFEPGQIEIALTEHAPPGLAGELSRKLEEWTGQRWMIAVAREAPRRPSPRRASPPATAWSTTPAPIRWSPPCSQRFPGAEIVDVRVHGAARPRLPPSNRRAPDARRPS